MMKAKMKAGGGMMKKGYQAGGVMKEGEMMDRMGRGMAKAMMQKDAEKMPMQKGGMTKKMMAGGGMTKKMQAGGGVTRGDGLSKVKTKGKMV